MIRAIFFDIDGTLTSFVTHEVPESAWKALRCLKEQGIRLFIATGRAKDGLGVLNDFPFDGYITLNGQYCFTSEGEVIYENTISRGDLSVLLEEIQKHPAPCGFVRRDDKVFNYRDQRVDDVHAITHNDDHPAGDVSGIIDDQVYQVMVFIDEEEEKQLMPKLKNCTSARWYPTFCDISPIGGTKVKGIDTFLKHFGIDLSETMAFGDGGNDRQMLEHVAKAVVMGNADDSLKQLADYVTDDVDHDGLYKAFVHYGMIPE